MKNYEKMIFDLSVAGRRAYALPELDVPESELKSHIPENYLRKEEPDFPELFELDIIRHYTKLSQKNFGIDTGFYPLGSCTMKYNPKINEQMARLDGFANIHPLQDESTVQGALKLMYEFDKALCEITGMDKMTLNPAAGAHGEFTGVNLIKRYHESRGDMKRDKIIVPDSAHGTNPATAVMAGCSVIEVPSNEKGLVDIEALKAVVGDDTCALMLTNPNTVGLFDTQIKEITDIIHEAGGLVYYDGANANAIMGHARPGDMGFDVVHLNIHKTLTTPHGGGGPGSGPVGVKKILEPFLPVPTVEMKDGHYYLQYDIPQSIGRVKDFQGHFAMMVRAYTYVLMMGSDGLKEASTIAVLNANYIKESLKDDYKIFYDQVCKHECIFAGLKDNAGGTVHTLDVAKRLMDKGFHPPTIYFPLIVPEALMIEPTETESKETLDAFIQAMKEIAGEARENPDEVRNAPQTTVVRRPDETLAARNPILKYEPEK